MYFCPEERGVEEMPIKHSLFTLTHSGEDGCVGSLTTAKQYIKIHKILFKYTFGASACLKWRDMCAGCFNLCCYNKTNKNKQKKPPCE